MIIKNSFFSSLCFSAMLAVVGQEAWTSAVGPDGSSKATSADYSALPPLTTSAETPLVMLVMSNDHQLYKKAYTDYTDLDGDGNLDTNYNDSFEYYGYFNSDKCYVYQTGLGYFEPSGDVDVPGSDHKCTGSNAAKWSGNFLNWTSMTRMDVVRKVLYGGKRSTDASNNTVLERALLPQDVHAFVKVASDSTVDGDVSDYTPFSDSTISMCNVTDQVGGSSLPYESRDMSTSVNPPLIKVVTGFYPQWSASEVIQCVYDDEGGNGTYTPHSNQALTNGGTATVTKGKYIARVRTCVSGEDQNASYCREYKNSGGVSSYKPAGLLQQYGENDDIKFGLMTGSYEQNNEGGVLRKNITEFSGINAVTSDNEVNLDDGTFHSLSNGIVSILDRMRIGGWDYIAKKYDDCSTHSIGISTFKSSTSANRECKDWGNPLSEIYLEALRYFAGASSRTSSFNTTSDASWISGMNTASWNASGVLSTNNACAECSIIVLSTGLNMFDSDNLSTASSLPGLSGSSDVTSWTEDVGDDEGITGNNYIVGNANGGTSNNLCTSKNITNLGNVKGLCPEIPQLEGTYNIAGLAYYGYSTDLRTTLDGTQNVKTYTVALAESLPSFEIQTSSSNTVSFVPVCRANTNGGASLGSSGWNDCSLTDVKVVQQTSTYGQILFTWEDSHWGNDYDMDGVSSIEYCTATGSASAVQSACPKYSTNGSEPNWVSASTGDIQIRASVPQANAGNALSFGFVMNGAVSGDGTYIDVLRPGGQTIQRLYGMTNGTIRWDNTVRKFTASSSTGALLKNPLWYAAKYGSFDDQDDNDGTPLNINGDDREWDTKDTSGNLNPDGIPDNFFPVSNPADLANRLDTVFKAITDNVSSSSAAAVVSNSAGGTGAIYQAVYEATRTDQLNNEVDWVGSVISFFVDDQSRFREDKCASSGTGTNCNKTLDSNDPIIQFGIDANGETVFSRIDPADGVTVLDSNRPFSELHTLWDASTQLTAISDSNITTQRTYSSSADTGRYIFTWIDGSGGASLGADGIVDTNEVFDFIASEFPAIDSLDSTLDKRRFLGYEFGTDTNADALVNFVRGQDQSVTGWRSRALDTDGDGSTETLRLGDIIHSGPAVVGQPSETYGVRLNDPTYSFFRNRYLQRRQVLYVGANDGMLHAFNAGFYDAANKAFVTQLNGEVTHPLGSEMWAYIPQNLLPHLQWLKDKNYPHVYYMDGTVQSFDVNIFDDCNGSVDTCTHPYGWGTILVATMRFGGGDITIDPDSDIDVDTSDDLTMSSAVVIFDITDPEKAPVLLAEITDPALGFTTSKPAIYKSRPKTSSGTFDTTNQRWYLVFGSGPAGTTGATKDQALDDAISNQSARVYAINLSNKVGNNVVPVLYDFDTGTPGSQPQVLTSATNSFVGDFSTADWDSDFIDDAIYFGTVNGTPASPGGALWRMYPPSPSTDQSDLKALATSTFLTNNNQPFVTAPRPAKDRRGRPWVYAGTGRLFVSDDLKSTQQQSFHGIREPVTGNNHSPTYATVNKSSLIDTTDVVVFTSGVVTDASDTSTQGATLSAGNGFSTTANTYGEVQSIVSTNSSTNGWFIDLPANSARNLLSSILFRDIVIFDSFQPNTNFCQAGGTSKLFNLNMQSGVPSPQVYFATDSTVLFNTAEKIEAGVDLGAGQVIGLSPHNDNIIIGIGGGGTSGQGFKLDSKKATIGGVPFGRRSWREIPLNGPM